MAWEQIEQRHVQAVGPRRNADQKYCYSCGALLHVSAAACPACGAQQAAIPATLQDAPGGTGPSGVVRNWKQLAPNQVFCRGCGQPISELAPLCPRCGAPQSTISSKVGVAHKSKVVAALFAFFLGGLGVHKFYLGEIGLAIIYLLFCWTFIPSFIALIEGICYLAMSEESFHHRYG